MSASEWKFDRYQELQRYLNWTAADAIRLKDIGSEIAPHLPALIDDFYAEIQRHKRAMQVFTGGQAQIERLKGALLSWLHQLFTGIYDEEFVTRRLRVGRKHVEIGLDQVFANMALARLRSGMLERLTASWRDSPDRLFPAIVSLNKLLDLDLAIIEDAYETEFLLRQKRSERLIAIGQMAGGLAHELRNPLNVIKTSAYYLLNAKSAAPEKLAEHLHRIDRQVGLADNVIGALSDFAKLPLPQFEPIAIRDLLQEVMQDIVVPKEVAVSLDVKETNPRVLGDPRQLHVVFSNLVRNAIEAMPAGGQLSFHVRREEKHVEVVVEDTGSGILPEDMNRIMEPLFSTKARGIGLGLAISRAIVDNHRGQIRVTSEPDKGAKFLVRLPVAGAADTTS